MKLIAALFATFFKIGLFTFGGGYAMIPLIEAETVEKKKWIKSEELLDIIAIAESTPGPIAINSATFIGQKTAGFFGAFASTLGVVTPSFVIIMVISEVLQRFDQVPAVQYAFYGIRAGVLALLLKSLYSMYKKVSKDIFSYILMAASFAVAAFLDVDVIFIILSCAVFGLVYSFAMRKKSSAKEDKKQ